MPLRNPNFTGREDLLGQLERGLSATTAHVPEVLRGMGGIGKTQTVVEYIYRHAHDYDLVWWVPAKKPVDIRASLFELAKLLDIADGDEEAAISAVMRELEKTTPDRRWILVFDDAGSPSELHHFLPAAGGHVVVTSQSAEWETGPGADGFPDGTYVICFFDLEEFGADDRTGENRMAIRRAMHDVVETGFPQVGISLKGPYYRPGGDDILIAVPAVSANKGIFVGELLNTLTELLDEHNDAHPDEVVKLRFALHVGEIAFDRLGPDGRGIIHAKRLIDAPQLKAALAQSARPLTVITSVYVYDEVVKQHKKYAPDDYRRVPVQVKETDSLGWIRIPGHRLPSEANPSLGVQLLKALREFFGQG